MCTHSPGLSGGTLYQCRLDQGGHYYFGLLFISVIERGVFKPSAVIVGCILSMFTLSVSVSCI